MRNRPVTRKARQSPWPQLISPGVLPVTAMLSLLHLLNFLNYTVLRGVVNPPLTRSVLLIGFAFLLLLRHGRHLSFHLQRCWDVYAICLLALVSASYSLDPPRTLEYGIWLLISVYVGTELAARVRQPNDLVAALCIVLLPVSFFTALVNVALGPVVLNTGRQFGALGSAHVDTAYAMNFVCLFLALRVLPVPTLQLPRWLRWAMLATLAWALYQAVFGLTRSVWLGVAVALGLYSLRKFLNPRSFLLALSIGLIAVIAIDFIAFTRILPEAVQARLEVTEERIEAGYIDPRLAGIRGAYQTALEHPLGTGYAAASSHNSYMNMLLNLGWIGLLLALFALTRSALLVAGRGFGWLMVFAIGCGPLLLHAFFEVQTWPGQANFIPLLTWYALSRARMGALNAAPVSNGGSGR